MSYVLLLEPNTLLAQTYTQLLVHAGLQVTHVTSAQEAINAADTRTPSLVVLELQLPGHSGIEFLQEFRSYNEWLGVPAVVNTLITPSRMAALQEPLHRDLGVRAVLYKPQASLSELLQTVREYLMLAERS